MVLQASTPLMLDSFWAELPLSLSALLCLLIRLYNMSPSIDEHVYMSSSPSQCQLEIVFVVLFNNLEKSIRLPFTFLCVFGPIQHTFPSVC